MKLFSSIIAVSVALLLALSATSLAGCADYEKEVPQLIHQLKDKKTRNQAALRLGRIGAPHANRAVKPLIKLLNDRNVGVQTSAAYALYSIGTKEAKRALDAHRKR